MLLCFNYSVKLVFSIRPMTVQSNESATLSLILLKTAPPDVLWSMFLREEFEKTASRELPEVSQDSFSQIIFSNGLPKGDTLIVNFRTFTVKLSPSYRSDISHYFFLFSSLLWIFPGASVKNEASLFISEVKFCLEGSKKTLQFSMLVRKP